MSPWVGEPGRLSPDDRERLREERLRLVWRRLDCLVIFLKRELRFFLTDKQKQRHRGSKTSASLSWNVTECHGMSWNVMNVMGCRDILLSLLDSCPLAPSSHLGLVARPAGRTHFYGGVLERRGRNGHFISTLQKNMDTSQSSGQRTEDSGQRDVGLTFRMSSTTSVWTRPWTDSPLT